MGSQNKGFGLEARRQIEEQPDSVEEFWFVFVFVFVETRTLPKKNKRLLALLSP